MGRRGEEERSSSAELVVLAASASVAWGIMPKSRVPKTLRKTARVMGRAVGEDGAGGDGAGVGWSSVRRKRVATMRR